MLLWSMCIVLLCVYMLYVYVHVCVVCACVHACACVRACACVCAKRFILRYFHDKMAYLNFIIQSTV